MDMFENGFVVRNPLRCGELVEIGLPDRFENSKWLEERKSKLRKKYYTYKKWINGLIKWSGVIVLPSAVVVGIFYLLFITGLIQYSSPIIGFVIGLLAILVGLVTYSWLDDEFPTDDLDMVWKYRR